MVRQPIGDSDLPRREDNKETTPEALSATPTIVGLVERRRKAPSDAKNIIGAALGFALAIAALRFLFVLRDSWAQGAFMDCPNYAFGAVWYPEPRPPVTIASYMLVILDAISISIFVGRVSVSRRFGLRMQTMVNIIGLTLSCVPLVIGYVGPLISDLLRMSKPGC